MKHWDADFPVQSEEDGYVTRREFTKFLGLTSISFFLGACWAAARSFWKPGTAQRPCALPVMPLRDLAVGSYKLFRYPDARQGEPGILLRLGENTLAAFSQQCTHLACPIYAEIEKRQLVCPCHSGLFSAEDGRVLSGPPKRALQRFKVEVRGDVVWINGKENG